MVLDKDVVVILTCLNLRSMTLVKKSTRLPVRGLYTSPLMLLFWGREVHMLQVSPKQTSSHHPTLLQEGLTLSLSSMQVKDEVCRALRNSISPALAWLCPQVPLGVFVPLGSDLKAQKGIVT